MERLQKCREDEKCIVEHFLRHDAHQNIQGL